MPKGHGCASILVLGGFNYVGEDGIR